MDEKDRLYARELLLRSRIYRYIALCFAGLGLVLFIFLYLNAMKGDVWEALKQPSFIVMIAFPFLPAVILSRMSVNAGRKLTKFLDNLPGKNKG